jgi:hypothetical protein
MKVLEVRTEELKGVKRIRVGESGSGWKFRMREIARVLEEERKERREGVKWVVEIRVGEWIRVLRVLGFEFFNEAIVANRAKWIIVGRGSYRDCAVALVAEILFRCGGCCGGHCR